MAILGQEFPAANTQTVLYTVPTDSKCTIQVFHVTNHSFKWVPNSDTARVYILPSGITTPADQYLLLNYLEITTEKTIDILQDVVLRDWDSIVVEAFRWQLWFSLLWIQEYDADSEIWNRAQEIAWWDFTHATRYALLVWWAYQTNVNNCSCS